jgi:SAM-dependent methyltransferase
MQGDVVYADLWSSLAEAFRDDPRRENDPVVNAIVPWLTAESTVLDVGGGAGRYALPLALRCKGVTVLDPSPSMLESLGRGADEAGIGNVSAVQEEWGSATVTQHDVVLCANVVYGVAEIEPFVRKLAEAARERVAIVLFMDAPLSRMSPIWNAVHDEKRNDMPGLPELLPVLWEMGVYPNVEMAPPGGGPRTMPTLDAALAMARHFLYIAPGSEKDKRLQEVAPDFVVETEKGVAMRDASERPQGVVWWKV